VSWLPRGTAPNTAVADLPLRLGVLAADMLKVDELDVNPMLAGAGWSRWRRSWGWPRSAPNAQGGAVDTQADLITAEPAGDHCLPVAPRRTT
jgi:hypothetical protein